jgi:hypothetical protein
MELTFQPDQEIVLTDLHSGDSMRGRMVSLEGRLLSVTATASLALGALVKVEWDHYMVLGEVQERQPEAGMLFIHIEHVLPDVDQLARQKQAWSGHREEREPRTAPVRK